MSNDTRILRDKRLYENQVVVDTREELDVCVLSGMLLTEVSDYFRNLDQDLSSRYPGKHFRTKFNDYENESLFEVEVYHIESDEEQDDRVRIMENDVLMWRQRSKFNSENYRRELYETLKAEFENIKPKSALKSIN